MIELAIAKAVEGLFAGFIFGVIEAWNKKVILAFLFLGAILYLLLLYTHGAAEAAEPFTPLWGYAILLIFFIGGYSVGKSLYNEVTNNV